MLSQRYPATLSSLLLVFLLGHSLGALAQDPVSISDVESIEGSLQQTTYPDNPAAVAAYLFDLYSTEFERYEVGFGIRYNRRIRIKVYRTEGTDYGTVTIPYYRNGITMQIKNIRGATYNLDGSGKIQYAAVTEENVSDQKVYDRYYEKVIVFPQVKEGSVLDLSYDIVSTRPSLLPDFEVQAEIPKAYTRYQARIPAFYNYNLVPVGDIDYSRYDIVMSDVVEKYDAYLQFQRILVDIEAKNVPPFVREPYMPSERSILGKVEFQFAHMNLPDRKADDAFLTWEGFSTWLLKKTAWAGYYKKTRFIKDRMPQALVQGSGLSNAKAIYEWVQGQYTWDGYRAMEPDLDAKTNDGTKPVNIADINLSLYGALEVAGYEVYPLLGSTRDRGRINEQGPVLSQFNNVLVLLVIDGENYVLNGGIPYLPFGALLDDDQNGTMLRVHLKEPALINVTEGHKAK
ncbi:MAG: DUF3857 domain-containing protein [Bacteroidota bacterium]